MGRNPLSNPKRTAAANAEAEAYKKYVLQAKGKPDIDAYRQKLRQLWLVAEEQFAKNVIERSVAAAEARVQVAKFKNKPGLLAEEQRHLRELKWNRQEVLKNG